MRAATAAKRIAASAVSPTRRYWTQTEAAEFVGVSARTLRESSCPKLLLPGSGSRRIVRYDPDDVTRWAQSHRT